MKRFEKRAYDMHCLLKYHGKSDLSKEMSEWWYEQSVINKTKDLLLNLNSFLGLILFPFVVFYGLGLDKKQRDHDKKFKKILEKYGVSDE